MAWATIRGMPQARADFFLAQICSVLANVYRGKDDKVFEPGDFIPSMIGDEQEDEEAEPVVMIDLEASSKALEQMLGKKE